MKRTLLSIVCLTLLSLHSFSQTWIQQGPGFTTASRGMMNISIVDNQIAWVSAYDGTGGTNGVQDFSKTVNGGTTWIPGIVNAATGLQTSMLTAISATTAWVCMYKATGSNPQGVYKTTTGGTTWTHQASALYTNASSFPDWIYFWDANNGTVLGDPINGDFEIYTTTDGGTTWTAVPGSQIPNPLSGEAGYTANVCVHGNYVWFGTNKGRVFASTDKGHNWIVAAPFANTKNVFPAYRDSLSGLALKYISAADTLALLQKSTNGGTSYTALTYSGSPFCGEIKFVPHTPNTYVTTGVDATNQSTRLGVTYSFDGGVTWITEPTINGTQVTCSEWLNDSTGWIGSFNTDATDGLYKYHGVLVPPIIPIANFMTPDTLIPLGGVATFTNLSTGNPTSYAWTFPGGNPPNSTAQTPGPITYSVSGPHNVSLTVTNSNGSNTKTKTNYIHVGGVGITELNANAISVFPNPVKDVMTVQANSNIKEIQVYNAAGQLMINQTVNAKTITINASALSTGIYNLKAKLDNGTINKKVVIQ
jgi:PKD repeat protein